MNKIYDIVIYGPTSAGVAAAVQAKRMGKSVIIVGPDKHLGGLTAGGLGWTDSGNKDVIGGISREFYQRVPRLLRPAGNLEMGETRRLRPLPERRATRSGRSSRTSPSRSSKT